MGIDLLYRRPEFVPWETSPTPDSDDSVSITTEDLRDERPAEPETSPTAETGEIKKKKKKKSRRKEIFKRGIPKELCFDRIINNQTCPPMTQRDFLNYLLYIEHSAENLQFFLWFKEYERRFALLPESEKALSPQWKPVRRMGRRRSSMGEKSGEKSENIKFAQDTLKENAPTLSPPPTKTSFGPEALLSPPSAHTSGNPFDTAPSTPTSLNPPTHLDIPMQTTKTSDSSTSQATSTTATLQPPPGVSVEELYHGTDSKLQPFTIQPFRSEIARMLTLYFAPSSERELNLTYHERNSVLEALVHTTHPSALLPAVKAVEFNLRHQAHPNFVRWSICNANKPRMITARIIGLVLIAVGFITVAMLTIKKSSKPLRITAFIPWFFGMATLVAGFRGMCVFIHGFQKRHVKPWELFEGTSVEDKEADIRHYKEYVSAWKKKYENRGVLARVFDGEVPMEDPALQHIQNIIFTQSVVAGFAFAAIVLIIFLCI